MKRKWPFTLEEFKEIYSRVPRLCVDLVVKTEKGIILTLRTAHGWEGQWHFPGGTVFYQEGVENAVHRIAEEELAMKVSIVRELGHLQFPNEAKARGYGDSVSIVFLCEVKEEGERDESLDEVGYFKEPPENMIVEQKEFLLKQDI